MGFNTGDTSILLGEGELMAYYVPYQNQYVSQLALSYTPVQVPQQNVAPVQQNNNGIIWIQGEQAAKSYMVAPNNTVLLMDSEDSIMYIKSTDQSGMPRPLRVFEYKERTQTAHNAPASSPKASDEYVSRKEFEAFRDDVRKEFKGIHFEEEGEG